MAPTFLDAMAVSSPVAVHSEPAPVADTPRPL
jgi:hypothetical protein